MRNHTGSPARPGPTFTALERGSRHRALALVGAFLTAFLVALGLIGGLGASPASAHSQLIDSSPQADETFDTPPTEVTLTFNEELIDYGGGIEVVDADGTDWTNGDLAVSGQTATIAVASDMPAGDFEVRWQVTSADGHPVSGVIAFTVTTGGEGATDVDPAEATDPAESTEQTSGSDASDSESSGFAGES
ncbi:MAG: copper resistance CopC family protein, partial [Pseudoclavibacter sp.]